MPAPTREHAVKMNPGAAISPEGSDLKKELILAQIRLMELEDRREAAAVKCSALENDFKALQALADLKLDENAHLGRISASLENQLRSAGEELARLNHLLQQQRERSQTLETVLNQTQQTIATQAEQLRTLTADLARMQRSLSWRLTAPFRAIHRRLGGSKR